MGVLHTAIILFPILGNSKTALLQLREIITLKIQNRLYRKYKYVLERFDKDFIEQEHIASRKIWIFWWQGIENAPIIVQRCFSSVKEHLSDWEIILITEDNYREYASFPDHILQKLENGQITLTHFSDLLRLELLIHYGGLWLDATIFCTSDHVPMSILNSDLFFYQVLKPGVDGRPIYMSSWCMFAKTYNKILLATRALLYEYWKKKTSLIDYFLIHQFFSIVCNRYPSDSNKVPPFCNSIPHILQHHLFDKYDETYWYDLKQMTCFHKLTYKLEQEDVEKKGTYYDMIVNNGL